MSCPSILRSAAVGFLTILSVTAAPEAKPDRHVRFLAVGDSPPFRQEIRDGIRYELDPPADSVPPREIVPGFGKEIADAVTLRLGRISAPVKVPEGDGTIDLRRAGEAPDAAPWLSLKRPESGDFLVYLYRSHTKQTWRDAVSFVVPDGPVGFPAGSVRIVNLYPLSIRIMWGSETLTLPAGKTILHAIKPGAEVPFQILVADEAGTMKRYYSGAVTQNQNERGLVTIYRSDAIAPRRPVKVSMLREPVAPPPPAKEEAKKKS
jgi:hypothetical protein